MEGDKKPGEDLLSKDKNEPHCLHYVKRKKRYCKMTLKKGHQYCGEHIPKESSTDENNLLRVTCPLDPKHTCYAYNLAKHLKICNAKPQELPFISKNINCGDEKLETENTGTRLLANAEAEEIKTVIDKINKVYDEHKVGIITESFKAHILLKEELDHPEYSAKTKKHLIQVSSILGILEENNLLQDDTCYIEFGAGKGLLSFWLSKAIERFKNSAVLLVERASHRHKKDNKVDKTTHNIHRVKADIGDLILNKVDVVNNYKYVVGLTKHLCGDATDLTIRCMKNFMDNGGNVAGLLMAFCCHHKCQWNAFTGKDFFMKNEITKNKFDIMCGLVSWAICGNAEGKDKCEEKEEVFKNERDEKIGINREDKKVIGVKSKNLIDFARTQYLIENGFKSALQFYVPSTVSPENLCVIAIKK